MEGQQRVRGQCEKLDLRQRLAGSERRAGLFRDLERFDDHASADVTRAVAGIAAHRTRQRGICLGAIQDLSRDERLRQGARVRLLSAAIAAQLADEPLDERERHRLRHEGPRAAQVLQPLENRHRVVRVQRSEEEVPGHGGF